MKYEKGNLEYDLDRSNREFHKIVWPRINKEWDWFEGCELTTPEKIQGDKTGLLLDQAGGIDYVAKRRIGGLVPIASRVQGDFPFRTFTVRYSRPGGAPTEFKKIREALIRGDLAPKFQTHAYVDDSGRLLRAFGVRVVDLYGHIEAIGRMKENPSDGVTFLYVEVDLLRARNVEVREVSLNIDEFFASLRQKHRPYYWDKPGRLHGGSWSNKCQRCDGSGKVQVRWIGNVRCGACYGSGLKPQGAKR
jgi:hypothetical protein